MPPSLQIHDAQVADCFASRTEDSAKQLASLINACPNSLDTVFTPIFHQLDLHSRNQIKSIDSLLQFLTSVASYIDPSLCDDGVEEYGSILRKPLSGPEILAERLSEDLYQDQWNLISCSVTPDEEYYNHRECDLGYYQSAAVYGTILARAFVVQPDLFRDRLWREVEDVFVKGLFTGEREPGAYVMIAALLLGAGKDIRTYLNDNHVGKGKDWVWYNDECSNEDTWGWADVVEELERTFQSLPAELPEYVRASFNLAKGVIGESSEANWDSNTLAHKVFPWASRIS